MVRRGNELIGRARSTGPGDRSRRRVVGPGRAVGDGCLTLLLLGALFAGAPARATAPEANAAQAAESVAPDPEASEVAAGSGSAAAPTPTPGKRHPALDPRARLPEGSSSSEQWDLVAELESGHRIFARFLITNLGPGERNGVAIGHLITPNGGVHEFHNGRTRDAWKLEHDRAYLNIGSSELDLRSPALRLDVDKDHLLIDLPFAPDGARSIPEAALPDGYHSDLLALAAPTLARVWVPAQAEPLESVGRVTLTHTWMDDSEGDLVLRRLEVIGQDAHGGFYLNQLRSPGGDEEVWVAHRSGAGETSATRRFSLQTEGKITHSREDRYVVPQGLTLKGDRVSGDVLFEGVVLEHDPLGDLPQPFRFLVSLSMRPFRVWAAARIDVTLRADREDPPLPVSVPGVAVVTFMNPATEP